jgi:hypothetical protein
LPGRILTMQRQVRELGRLRTGYTAGNRPVRSKTWILTAKDRDLLDAAAEEWGGQVVEWTPLNHEGKQWSLTTETAMLPAFLPPGDPLTQSYEQWNRGGAVRRCDGNTESKSGNPCICRALGEKWYERSVKEVCKPYSQLNVMLLNLPDIGVWRHVTKSYYAAGEIAGMVDLIKAQVGPEPIVPVWLVIDQRESVKDGKKTPYPVPAIKIRGAHSGAALLSGDVPTLELGAARSRPALEAAPVAAPAVAAEPQRPKLTPDKVVMFGKLVRNVEQLQQLWKDAAGDDVLTEGVKAFLTQRAEQLKNGLGPRVETVEEPPADVVEGEPEPDPTAVLTQVMALAGAAPRKWSTAQVEERLTAFCGKGTADANGWELAGFLDAIKSGEVR